MTTLITGVAGFIGMHVAHRLLAEGEHVIGVDNLSPYYDIRLKHARLASLARHRSFQWLEGDINDPDLANSVTRLGRPGRVVHLAAQPGVRHSLKQPLDYASANLSGFVHVLEWCRHWSVDHLVFASSSSVYGGNRQHPFSEQHRVDHPVSLYAATKKANELMAHTYSHLYGLPVTGLRFFTVYGPWGRPDMAAWGFTESIATDRPIHVYNHGNMVRDFTYVDDVVESVVRVLRKPATPDPAFNRLAPNPASSWAPYRIFNVGNAQPVKLDTFITAIESALGRRAQRIHQPIQPGDVELTSADTQALHDWIGTAPATPVQHGVEQFVAWYRDYHAKTARD